MFATLSERRLSETIKQLEGLDPNTTVQEVMDRMSHYASRLFRHISTDYGVTMVGMQTQSGELATFQFALAPIGQVHEVNGDSQQAARIQGLDFMNPNSVTVEQGDIAGLVPPGIMQTVLLDEWDRYAHTLQRILPSEIPGLLESAAQTAMRVPSSTMIGDPQCDQELFLDFCNRSGVRDPSAKSRAIQEHNQREIEAHQAAEQDRVNREWANREGD